jgi:hypothetical protein
MNGALAGWDMACRIIGECRFGLQIDREFQDMVLKPNGARDASNWTGPKQFAYVRYDPDVSQPGLNDLGLADVKAENVQVMDSVKYIPDIQRVGRAFADKHLDLVHLTNFA